MTKFRFVLVLLCLGLLGAVAVIAGLPRANAGQEAAMQQPSYSSAMRAEIGTPLNHAINLAVHRSYDEAEKVVDGLNTVPNKNSDEVRAINQVRQFIAIKRVSPPI